MRCARSRKRPALFSSWASGGAHDAQSKILSDSVDEADVQLVWDPPWNQNMIIEAGRMKLGRSEAARACSALVLQWSQAEGMLDCVVARIFL
ncbi:MAG: hypothetical protein DME76_18805 [Verrucomicrobia bacterium]|nr:MAG: hypothetical protein DME76_18805 [Verrucomicrobiota bacterium]